MAIDINLIFSATGQPRVFSSPPLALALLPSLSSQFLVTQGRDRGTEARSLRLNELPIIRRRNLLVAGTRLTVGTKSVRE